jgi:hypothetical protein
MKTPKPKWWLLYGVLPLGAALLAAAELVSPTAGWLGFTEGLASLIIIGAMALWVHANRVALALPDEPSGSSEPLKVWVAFAPPATLRRTKNLAGIPQSSLLAIYTEPTREEEAVRCCAK